MTLINQMEVLCHSDKEVELRVADIDVLHQIAKDIPADSVIESSDTMKAGT